MLHKNTNLKPKSKKGTKAVGLRERYGPLAFYKKKKLSLENLNISVFYNKNYSTDTHWNGKNCKEHNFELNNDNVFFSDL